MAFGHSTSTEAPHVGYDEPRAVNPSLPARGKGEAGCPTVPFPIYVPTARIDEIGTRARLTDRNARSFSCFLRLPDGPRAPGREAVEARLAVVAENLDREHPLPENQEAADRRTRRRGQR